MKTRIQGLGCPKDSINRKSKNEYIVRRRGGGGVRPFSPLRHDTTAPEEPFCARGSIRLSLFLYYELLTRTCLSGSSLISLSLLGFRVDSSLFGIPFVKPFLFVNLYFL